ncbi:hypothetical protein D9758_005738 [Tetrapyrgos nigripes]|uniref:Uncharacterized protein n=1 Tax=Tetrapyrgos nigripes TaxID=182062 RepID=A0A8H5LQZ2_9AGAR|nr:hypothetical protein D9758_005738 [Tetrapyrgos nigripes]
MLYSSRSDGEVLGDRWCFIVEYGDEVVQELGKLTIPEMSVSKKRSREEESEYEDGGKLKDMEKNLGDGQNQGSVASTSTTAVEEAPMPTNTNHSNTLLPTANTPQSTHPHPYYMLCQWLNGPHGFAWYYVPTALPQPTNPSQSAASYPYNPPYQHPAQ